MSVLTRKVLVLNKSWFAIHVVTLRRAITLLFKGYATVIDPKKIRPADLAKMQESVRDNKPVEWDIQTFTWKVWSDTFHPKDGEDCITTASRTFRCPEVIVLHDYNKLPTQRLNFSRRSLYRRDNNTCQYCGEQPGTEELTIDHIFPKSMGGKTTWDNCTLACVKCNARKANRTPEMANMKLRRQPFKPKFNLFKGDIRVESWEAFLGNCYWSVTLKD